MTGIHSSGRRAARGVRVAALALLAAAPASLAGQRLIDYTPNTRPAWTLDRWQPAMILSHRLELVEGNGADQGVPR